MKMQFLVTALFVALSHPAQCTSMAEYEINRDWHSLLFGLGTVESDYYIEDPIVVICPTKEGALLSYHSPGKNLYRSIDESQLKGLLVRLTKIFTGATPPTAATDRPVPRFLLRLSINQGFTNESFIKETTPTVGEENLESMMKLIKELFPDAWKTEQGAAANPYPLRSWGCAVALPAVERQSSSLARSGWQS